MGYDKLQDSLDIHTHLKYNFSETVKLTEILANAMADFRSGDFAVWEAPT